MAKFKVGDLVDVRLCYRMDAPTHTGLVHVDDCIPHVPAPVVPPAPVDPLTGLTAAEMERQYSKRLTAFGQGEADPFAPRPERLFGVRERRMTQPPKIVKEGRKRRFADAEVACLGDEPKP